VDSKPKQDRSSLIVPLALLAALLPVVGAILWYLERNPAPKPGAPTLTAEAKAYTQHLKLSGVEMKKTESYVGSSIVEIIGNITNNGTRTLERVELTCIFYDAYGQLVFRQRVPIVRSSLKPGDARSFRLPFEGIPESWNQALPALVIASIHFSRE
jgi:hypothetical protein